MKNGLLIGAGVAAVAATIYYATRKATGAAAQSPRSSFSESKGSSRGSSSSSSLPVKGEVSQAVKEVLKTAEVVQTAPEVKSEETVVTVVNNRDRTPPALQPAVVTVLEVTKTPVIADTPVITTRRERASTTSLPIQSEGIRIGREVVDAQKKERFSGLFGTRI